MSKTIEKSVAIPTWTLSDRLRKARMFAGYDQIEFAARVGISRATVGNYEQDRVEPKRVALIAWASVTGVPFEWLVNDESPAADSDGAEVVRPKGFEPLAF